MAADADSPTPIIATPDDLLSWNQSLPATEDTTTETNSHQEDLKKEVSHARLVESADRTPVILNPNIASLATLEVPTEGVHSRESLVSALQSAGLSALIEKAVEAEASKVREECGAMMVTLMKHMEHRYKSCLRTAFVDAVKNYEAGFQDLQSNTQSPNAVNEPSGAMGTDPSPHELHKNGLKDNCDFSQGMATPIKEVDSTKKKGRPSSARVPPKVEYPTSVQVMDAEAEKVQVVVGKVVENGSAGRGKHQGGGDRTIAISQNEGRCIGLKAPGRVRVRESEDENEEEEDNAVSGSAGPALRRVAGFAFRNAARKVIHQLDPDKVKKTRLSYQEMLKAITEASATPRADKARQKKFDRVPTKMDRRSKMTQRKSKLVEKHSSAPDAVVSAEPSSGKAVAPVSGVSGGLMRLNDPESGSGGTSSTGAVDVLQNLDIWMHGMVLEEHGTIRRSWDAFLFLVLITAAFRIPYKLSFVWPREHIGWFGSTAEIVNDMIFLFDIVINFFTSYRNAKGLVEWDLSRIAAHYAITWLGFDLFCNLPWDRLLKTFLFPDAHWPAFLRLIRILFLLKFEYKLKYMERYFDNPGGLRLCRLGLMTAVTVHWFACITYIEADRTSDPDKWFGVQNFMDQENVMKYTSLVYWVSGCMLGERSSPQDVEAVLVSVIVFWGGLLVYFTICSNLITVLVNMNLAQIEYDQSKDRRTAYMKQLKVPQPLRLKIMDYFDELNAITRGVDAQVFMQELPYHLRQELTVFLNEKSLVIFNLFENCGLPFITTVMMRLKIAVCLEGDLVCIEGDLGDEMYFIIQGELAVYKQGIGKVGTLQEGDFFGEGLMLEENGRRSASVKALRACTMYSLNKKMFAEIKVAYPEDSKVFFRVNHMRKESSLDLSRSLVRSS